MLRDFRRRLDRLEGNVPVMPDDEFWDYLGTVTQAMRDSVPAPLPELPELDDNNQDVDYHEWNRRIHLKAEYLKRHPDPVLREIGFTGTAYEIDQAVSDDRIQK